MHDLKIQIEKSDGTCEGVKRQHAPVVIHWVCPSCGRDRIHDLENEYLFEPTIGAVNSHTLCCHDCGNGKDWEKEYEFEVKLQVDIVITVVGK